MFLFRGLYRNCVSQVAVMVCMLMFLFVTSNVVPGFSKFGEKLFQAKNSSIGLILIDSKYESEDDLIQSNENLLYHKTGSSNCKIGSRVYRKCYLKVTVPKHASKKLFIDFGALII